MRRLAPLFVLVLALVPTAAGARTFVTGFHTPSGNIGCMYASGLGSAPSLRCDIRSGLKPKPRRPKGCIDLEWGDSYNMGQRGRVFVTCHGDTALDPRTRVLGYGQTWKRPGFVCTSKRVGLRCRNRSGHGFFMSRGHSYRF